MNKKIIYDLAFSFLLTTTSGIALAQLNAQSLFLLGIYFVFFIWFGYRSLVFAFDKKRASSSIKADIISRDSKFDFNPSLIPPFGFIVTFGLVCQQLSLYDSSLFEIPHTIVGSTSFQNHQWMIYALDNFIRAVMFDFLETYHIKISHIDSNNGWILTLVFVFKSVLSLFFIKCFYNLIKATKKFETS